MQQYENPFSMRASEKMTSDDVFISLFSEASLYSLKDLSDKGKLWGNLTYLCSAPGGGKTTLLRCFSPTVLYLVQNNRKENGTLFKLLKSMEVLNVGKIRKCGAYLLTNRSYSYLEDDEVFTKPKARRLFFALLNARFALTAVKVLQKLKNLSYEDLSQVVFSPSLELANQFVPESVPHTAQQLFDWAAGIERQITDIIETYEGADARQGHDSLFILHDLHASDFTLDGKTIVDEFIFQLDDCHKLSRTQLDFLRQELVETRVSNTVWLAMRYDKFTYEELMPKTDMVGRDYNNIHLGIDNNFTSMLGSILTKRSNCSSQNIKLNNSLEQNSILSDSQYQTVIDYSRDDIAQRQKIYDELLLHINETFESPKDRAEHTFALMLYAQREFKSTLPMFPHERSTYERCIRKDLIVIAQQIIPAVCNFPMYYGEDRLKELSSNNTEQFIGFCNVLYEQLLTQKLLHPRRALLLSAAVQDKLIKDECRQKLGRIFIEQGRAVYNFIKNVGGFCRSQTYQLGCSYGAVNGFAIKDVKTLFGNNYSLMDDSKLQDVLRICLANNLLFARDTKQGEKNQEWTVFYLNRWICAAFSLPLGFGGWRKREIKELTSWINKEKEWDTGIRML